VDFKSEFFHVFHFQAIDAEFFYHFAFHMIKAVSLEGVFICNIGKVYRVDPVALLIQECSKIHLLTFYCLCRFGRDIIANDADGFPGEFMEALGRDEGRQISFHQVKCIADRKPQQFNFVHHVFKSSRSHFRNKKFFYWLMKKGQVIGHDMFKLFMNEMGFPRQYFFFLSVKQK